DATSIVRAKSAEEFPDARVERDVVGRVVAITPYAMTLDTPDGLLALPFEAVVGLDAVDPDPSTAKPLRKSTCPGPRPVLPGDPAAKAKGLDAAKGVTAVTDGDVVRHVFVTAPFAGEVFGVRLRDKAEQARERTDLRFDTVVVPRRRDGVENKPAEIV